MTAGVKCSACGSINPLGRIHCVRCGARLDVSNFIHPRAVGSRGRVARVFRLLLLLALLLALVQLLRPVIPSGEPGTTEDGARLTERLKRLESAADAQIPALEVLPEREVNGYLQHLLTNAPRRESNAWIRHEVGELRLQFQSAQVTLVWTTRLGGALPLTFEVAGVPQVGADRFQFVLSQVRVGHLPLPGPAGAWAARRLAQMFTPLTRERRLLDMLDELTIEPGRAQARAGQMVERRKGSA